ncbi:MAG: hypothetical protein KAW41_01950 [Candidatus Diapherotrites archaeon]|nr:hypothetical protein [Candidatus Diapherotrites archaeon]
MIIMVLEYSFQWLFLAEKSELWSEREGDRRRGTRKWFLVLGVRYATPNRETRLNRACFAE